MTRFTLALAPAILALAACGGPEEVTVAAASSMSAPIEEIVALYRRESGAGAQLSLGSSGNFFAQISNGAPFDVFLAADMDYPRALEEAGLVEPGSVAVYAIGRIVLWVRRDSALDVERLGMDALLDPAAGRIAIANPRLAPYGAAAIAAMESRGIYDQVAPRIVLGENISQAAQFVASGAAGIGVIALSLAGGEGMRGGRYWEIPADVHPPIEHGMAILARAREAGRYEAALAFRDTVLSPEGRAILERYGFSVP